MRRLQHGRARIATFVADAVLFSLMLSVIVHGRAWGALWVAIAIGIVRCIDMRAEADQIARWEREFDGLRGKYGDDAAFVAEGFRRYGRGFLDALAEVHARRSS